ncbi:cardiolipin synthetase 2 [Loktanella fryxellensis]|uniref:Phospholipase D n=1 Tax=Loktanella fryxellensis TaxID=245187 RepID=A0A1H8DS07_9RHOB|nr:phospholipase D-like domain-containing protein [Loktanella fryxellensis]SEN09338.1 cardiolipin synthetase 2 [Loktanella fryxellensis]
MPFDWLITHGEIVLIGFVVLAAATYLLQQRRSPQSTAAWLLFLIMVPYLAIPIFVGLGVRKRAAGPGALTMRPLGGTDPQNAVDHMLRSYRLPGATGGHTFTLHDSPEAARTALFDMVKGAQTRIDAQFYIVARDDIGRAFVTALTERARAGVKVRLIIDRLGSLFPPRHALKALIAAGGEVHWFSPFVQPPMRGHLNLRNHRKIVVVDNTRVFAGGMNVGEEYMGKGPDVWTDLAFSLTGPAVGSFDDVFASDWDGTGGEAIAPAPFPPPGSGTAVVQVAPSGPDLRHDGLHDALVSAIHRAERRIWIVTPYFLPTDTLAEALLIAGRRGIDVRIMLPRRSNQKIADFARGAYLRDLHRSRARVLKFNRGMIHAKAGIIDDVAYIGSVNFDVRSMLLNFEDALILHDAGSVGRIDDWFAAQFQYCEEGIAPAKFLRRVGEGLFRIGAPVL